MFFDLEFPLNVAAVLSSVLCLAAFACIIVRVVKGPTGFDRVVALDLLGGLCLCLIVACSIFFEQQVLMEAALAIAVVNFLGTVAFAGYLRRGGEQ